MSEGESAYSKRRVVAAWGVHFYTALGLPLMFFSVMELMKNYGAVDKDPRWFFLLNWIAVIVDATDGFMARKVKVKDVVPSFSGRRLDDLVDFLSFAFLPCTAMVAFDLLPDGYQWTAFAPIMASGYGFCQEHAKTDDAFVGFPSYWNIMLIYLYVLDVDPWINLGVMLFLAVMVFVPLHYIYPTRARFMMSFTIGLGALWGLLLLAFCLQPRATWTKTAAWWSLAYPVYYMIVSVLHHRRVHASASA